MNQQTLISQLRQGDTRALARCISLVENEAEGWQNLLQQLTFEKAVPVVGFTGPPGAGKSSLVNAMITHLLKQNMKIAVIAVDPTSPFNYGSILGDRIRMSDHFTNPNVFIRSMATRGSLGGLSRKIYETVDVIKQAGFDLIIIETVGVGQSEVEIAGLADTTVVVLVPEAGDEVQTIKSGVMEIADIFVVNKSDREGADTFVKNLQSLLHEKAAATWQVPVIKTVATADTGIDAVAEQIFKHNQVIAASEKQVHLLFDKAWHIIQNEHMRTVDRQKLWNDIQANAGKPQFNLYHYLYNDFLKT